RFRYAAAAIARRARPTVASRRVWRVFDSKSDLPFRGRFFRAFGWRQVMRLSLFLAASLFVVGLGAVAGGARGPIWIQSQAPAGADACVHAVDGPSTGPACVTQPLAPAAMYRRPLPSTNLPFITAIMWDGREPSLAHQANDATMGHAQGAPLTPDDQQAIVAF